MSPESRYVGPKRPELYMLVVVDEEGQPVRAQTGFMVKGQPHPTVRYRDVRGKTMEELGRLATYDLQRLPVWKN